MSSSSVSVEKSYLQIFGLGAYAEGSVLGYNRFLNGELSPRLVSDAFHERLGKSTLKMLEFFPVRQLQWRCSRATGRAYYPSTSCPHLLFQLTNLSYKFSL